MLKGRRTPSLMFGRGISDPGGRVGRLGLRAGKPQSRRPTRAHKQMIGEVGNSRDDLSAALAEKEMEASAETSGRIGQFM